ncbi:DUF975 family protein [Treponema sp. OMZ 840]|uniref:DUF975 family protein n=1 Tax=Treponema sp. OMZ 840 TaxID=244313 RepID=UPI003D89D69E
MFDGRQYKKQAREQLKGHWTTPVLITLLILAIFTVISIPQIIAKLHNTTDGNTPVVLITMIIIWAVMGVLYIAAAKFYLVLTENPDKATFSVFLEALNAWGRGVLGALWMILWAYLWSLLFIIPGIIKAIAYSQMPFILAENPQVSVRKAMKISMVMTKGYKADIFLLALSFIGWILLAILTGGIGSLWLMPYMYTTFTNTYRYLKADALKRGVLTNEDFGIPAVHKDVQ